jgi:TonB-linked SusC/RagA family outer membrane protein
MLSAGAVFAQTTITGKVTDAESGDPIEGVAVLVKGTTIGMFTDSKGRYSLDVPENEKSLLFTYVGRKTVERSIGESTTIDVSMEEEVTSLSEVVVTAVGISRSKKALGYDVATLSQEEVTKARSTNLVENIAGKVAGVRVSTQSGTAGGGVRILIRGASSLSGTGQPLFIVDGVPVSNSGYNGTRSNIISGGVDAGNRASDINPDDIEDMTILKGAAATALYGARARDGAIVITTKRGKRGGAKVTFNSSFRLDNVLVLPEFQNEYASGDDGRYEIENFTNGWGPRIEDVQDQRFPDFFGDSVTLQAFPDNVRNFYETGRTFINSFSLANANDQGDFRLGYTYLTQTGIVPNSGYDRHNISVSTGRDFGKRIEGRVSANYIRSTSFGRASQGSNNPNLLGINFIPRTTDMSKLSDPDNLVDEAGNPVGLNLTSNNPFWIINNNVYESELDRIFGSGEIKFIATDWLDFTARLGTDFFQEYRFRPTVKNTIGAANGLFTTAQIYSRNLNLDVLANVDYDFTPDLNLTAVAGYNVYETFDRIESWLASDLAADGLYRFNNASSSVPTDNRTIQTRLIGAFADFTLGYKDWLYLTVTGRNDWTSTLRNPGVDIENDDIALFYPSVGLSWVFSEALNIDPSILSYGKIRANYAEVGSAPNPYLLEFTYLAITDVFTQYQANNNTVPTTSFEATNVIPNAGLVPQRQRGIEAGVELNFFKSRLNLNLTYYNQTTDNQILNIATPQSTGFAARSINAGVVRNRGWEVLLSGYPIRSKGNGFSWNITANFQQNLNEVVELAEGLEELTLTSGFSGIQIKAEAPERDEEGNVIGDPQPFGLYGAGWQRDSASNEVIINPETGLRQLGDEVRLGNIYPDFTLGINNEFTFKGFLLSFLIDTRQGGVIYSSTVSGLRGSGLAIETLEGRGETFIDQGVNIDGDGNAVPNTTPVESMRAFWSNYTQNGSAESSTFDASFTKLREVRFGYTFPKSMMANLPIETLTLALEGRNLLLLQSNVPHIDPETNFFGTSLTGEGVEFQSVPSVRTFGFNLNLQF